MKGFQIRADEIKAGDVIDGVGLVSDVMEDGTDSQLCIVVGFVGRKPLKYRPHERVWITLAYSSVKVGEGKRQRYIFKCDECNAVRVVEEAMRDHLNIAHKITV